MILLQTEQHQWIEETCRRLSDATGWPICFLPQREAVCSDRIYAVSRPPAAAGPDESGRYEPQPEIEHCWSTVIDNGDETVGRLQIELPADARRDAAFTAVCDMTALTGELLSSLLKAQHALDRRTSDVATLVDIGMSLGDDSAPLGTLDRLLKAAVELTGFRSAAFFLLSPSVNHIKLRAVVGREWDSIPHPTRELEPGVPDLTALARGRSLIGPHESAGHSQWLPDGASLGFCVAVESEAGPLGTLWVYDRRTRMPDERETAAIESIAMQTATVLERVVLLKESAQQSRMQRDLQSASDSQHDGGHIRQPAQSAGIDLAARCTSRYELGGDLCEVIRIDETRTAIAVGDASGDSVPAALVMSAVRGSLRTLIGDVPDDAAATATVMQRINRTLYEITPAYQFMSLIYGVFDARDNRFTYTNAGHPTPLWLAGAETKSLKSHGLLLGVDLETGYDHSTIQLASRDLLVMYSDGITEARCGRRILFGSEGIVRAIRKQEGGSAEELLEAVWTRVNRHTAPADEGDDRTLLVMRVWE